MKRTILFFLAAALAWSAGYAQKNFHIQGRIDGIPDMQLFLVTQSERGADTLAKTDMKEGVFEFNGRTEGTKTASIIYSKGSLVTFMLENTGFIIHVTSSKNLVKGGEQQEVLNKFQELNIQFLKLQFALKQEYQKASDKRNQAAMDSISNAFDRLVVKGQADELELLRDNGDNYAAAYVVSTGMYEMAEQQLLARYLLLSDQAKASFHGKEIGALLSRYAALQVGKVAPEFQLPMIDGTMFSLKDAKGKLRIVDFWASWCAPCRDENPNMLQLLKKYHKKGLEIISISLDTNPTLWQKASNEDGVIWHNCSDLKGPESPVAQTYCVRAIPYTLLLDERNVIIAKNLRGEALKKKIEELLK